MSRSWTLILQVALGTILLLGAVPSLSAHWASITHFGQIGDHGSGELGRVTIDACDRTRPRP